MQRAMIVKLMAKAVKTLCCKSWGQGMLGKDQNASQGSRHGKVSKRPGACWDVHHLKIQTESLYHGAPHGLSWGIAWTISTYFIIFPRCQYLSIGSPLRTKLTKIIAAHASYPKGMQGLCVCHEMFMWWKSIVMVQHLFFLTNLTTPLGVTGLLPTHVGEFSLREGFEQRRPGEGRHDTTTIEGLQCVKPFGSFCTIHLVT